MGDVELAEMSDGADDDMGSGSKGSYATLPVEDAEEDALGGHTRL